MSEMKKRFPYMWVFIKLTLLIAKINNILIQKNEIISKQENEKWKKFRDNLNFSSKLQRAELFSETPNTVHCENTIKKPPASNRLHPVIVFQQVLTATQLNEHLEGPGPTLADSSNYTHGKQA